MFSMRICTFGSESSTGSFKQEAHGRQFAHLIKTAITYLQMPCNILPVLPQQLGHKVDHTIKRLTVILIDLESPVLYTHSDSKFSWYWRIRFLSLFTIYGHGSHLVQWCKTIWTNCQHPFYRNMKKMGQAVSEKKTFKDFIILYLYRAQGARVTWGSLGGGGGGKIFILTKRFYYFNHTL